MKDEITYEQRYLMGLFFTAVFTGYIYQFVTDYIEKQEKIKELNNGK